MTIDWSAVETSVVQAVSGVLDGNGVAAAQDASRGAIFLARAEQTMQENGGAMSAQVKALLARQQQLAFTAFLRGYEGVTELVAAKALDAGVKALEDALGTAFLAAG